MTAVAAGRLRRGPTALAAAALLLFAALPAGLLWRQLGRLSGEVAALRASLDEASRTAAASCGAATARPNHLDALTVSLSAASLAAGDDELRVDGLAASGEAVQTAQSRFRLRVARGGWAVSPAAARWVVRGRRG